MTPVFTDLLPGCGFTQTCVTATKGKAVPDTPGS